MLTKRNFLELFGAGLLAFGAGINNIDAKADTNETFDVELSYKTILGNDPSDKRLLLSSLINRYTEYANYLSGEGSLSIPEDAAIQVSKENGVRLSLERRKLKTKNPKGYSRVMSKHTECNKRTNVCTVYTMYQFDFPKYVRDNDEGIKSLIEFLTKGYKTLEEKAQALLCFTQTAISYDVGKAKIAGNIDKDFVRTPERTMYDKKGDCKDTSVLYATLLMNLGVRPAFIFYDSHVNIGVPLNFDDVQILGADKLVMDARVKHKGKTYFIAETTPEHPMYIGKLMVAQRGRNIEEVLAL